MDGKLHGALIAVCVSAMLSSCGGDDGAVNRTVAPLPATVTLPTTLTPAPTQPVIIARVSPTPGRLAPDTTSIPLAFTQIRAVADPTTGVFALHANVTNTSTTFLNDISFAWRIVDASDAVLDMGDSRIATLAPSETAAVVLAGTSRYDEAWTAVQFTYPAVTP